MSRHTTHSMSRRGLFGLGAAAGAAVVTGAPFAAHAAPQGIGPTPDEYANAVTIALTPGASAKSLNAFDFNSFGIAVGNSSNVFSGYFSGMYNEPNGLVCATLDVPVGAALSRVDVLGNRSEAGSQAWTLVSVNVITGVDTVIGTAAPSGVGATQGTISLSPARVVSAGETFVIRLEATSANNRAVGAVYQYTSPGASFTAIAPRRVYDSRKDAAGKLARGATRTVNVSNEYLTTNTVVPAGATAVAYNLTATETEGTFGYLSVAPGGVSPAAVSALNWTVVNTSLANGLVVGLNSAREIAVLCDGGAPSKTHFIVDILGYYV